MKIIIQSEPCPTAYNQGQADMKAVCIWALRTLGSSLYPYTNPIEKEPIDNVINGFNFGIRNAISRLEMIEVKHE